MDTRETSEWNGAGDYLRRIDQALLIAGDAALTLNLYQWLHALKLFYREISSVMKEEEKKELYKQSEELSEQINKYLIIKNSQNRRHKIGIDVNIIKSLEQYEIELRRIYKESGLQMRLMEDASKSLR